MTSLKRSIQRRRLASSQGSQRGQSMLEYAVLVGAVASALVLMSNYVRQAFNAHAQVIEEELNGATDENSP